MCFLGRFVRLPAELLGAFWYPIRALPVDVLGDSWGGVGGDSGDVLCGLLASSGVGCWERLGVCLVAAGGGCEGGEVCGGAGWVGCR